jgi:hypothetical protein
MAYDNLKGNTNAEKWTLEEAEKFFNDAIDLVTEHDKAKDIYKYDFVGEVARELKSYKEVFTYLKDKYPTELKELHKRLISTLEANCFYNSKKGNINTAIGIVNLKSNHGWTDRNDFTSDGKELQQTPSSIKVKIIKSEDDE